LAEIAEIIKRALSHGRDQYRGKYEQGQDQAFENSR
jgi:hypothetical protein